ncbi:MAG: hypothetical protein ACRBFS_19545 [Aureispira sp.]
MAISIEAATHAAASKATDIRRLQGFIDMMMRKSRPLAEALIVNKNFKDLEREISECYIRIAIGIEDTARHAKNFTASDLYDRFHLYRDYLHYCTAEFRKSGVGATDAVIDSYMSFFDDSDNYKQLMDCLEYGVVKGFKPLKRLEVHSRKDHSERVKQAGYRWLDGEYVEEVKFFCGIVD